MSGERKREDRPVYPLNEAWWIFGLLILSAGAMGAYTYLMRGGVFCNAQTANFLMMAVAFGEGRWGRGLYYLVPSAAYFAGALLSEIFLNRSGKKNLLHWSTCLAGVEAAVLFGIGWVPAGIPHQVIQISVNFLASMQYNTFRQAEGIPMATTFCTNHVRQTGVGIASYLERRDKKSLWISQRHLLMILLFLVGGIAETVLCRILAKKAVWFSALIMGSVFILLAHEDKKSAY